MEAQSVAYGPLAVHAQSMMEQRMAEGGLADAIERQGISSASCNRSGCLSLWVPLQSPQDKLPEQWNAPAGLAVGWRSVGWR